MKIRFDTPPVSAQQSNGLAVRYAAAKREVPRWRWYLMLMVIGLPLMYFAWRFFIAAWWETAPGFVVVPTLTVKAASAGTVRDIVASGHSVERGAPLLRVEPVLPPPSTVVADARARRTTPVRATAASPGAQNGPDATLALLERAVALAERTLAFRRARLVTIETLKREAAATQAEADTSRAAVVQAEADVLRAQADVLGQRRALSDQAHAATAVVGEPAPTATVPASLGAGTAVIASPFSGTVTATLVVAGEYVTPTTDVLLLQGQEPAMIEAYVSPSDAQYAKVGRRASLYFFDGTRMAAVVTEVSGQAARIPSERVGPLSPRSQAILVRLRPAQELPARYRIVLPLDVRFDVVWPWSS